MIPSNDPNAIEQQLDTCKTSIEKLIKRYESFTPDFRICLYVERLFKAGAYAEAMKIKIITRLNEIRSSHDCVSFFLDHFYTHGATHVPSWVQPLMPEVYPHLQELIQGFFDFARLALGPTLIKELMQPLLLDSYGRARPDAFIIFQDLDIYYSRDSRFVDEKLILDPNAWFTGVSGSHPCYIKWGAGFDFFWALEKSKPQNTLQAHPYLATFLNILLFTFSVFNDLFFIFKDPRKNIISLIRAAKQWVVFYNTKYLSNEKIALYINSFQQHFDREKFSDQNQSIFERIIALKPMHSGYYKDGEKWVRENNLVNTPRALLFTSMIVFPAYFEAFEALYRLPDSELGPKSIVQLGLTELILKAHANGNTNVNLAGIEFATFYLKKMALDQEKWAVSLSVNPKTGAHKTVWGKWGMVPERPIPADLNSDPFLKHLVEISELPYR